MSKEPEKFSEIELESLTMLLEANGEPVSFWMLYELDPLEERLIRLRDEFFSSFMQAIIRHNNAIRKGHAYHCASNCPLTSNQEIIGCKTPRGGLAYRIAEYEIFKKI